jgi:hypothetical protein
MCVQNLDERYLSAEWHRWSREFPGAANSLRLQLTSMRSPLGECFNVTLPENMQDLVRANKHYATFWNNSTKTDVPQQTNVPLHFGGSRRILEADRRRKLKRDLANLGRKESVCKREAPSALQSLTSHSAPEAKRRRAPKPKGKGKAVADESSGDESDGGEDSARRLLKDGEAGYNRPGMCPRS